MNGWISIRTGCILANLYKSQSYLRKDFIYRASTPHLSEIPREKTSGTYTHRFGLTTSGIRQLGWTAFCSVHLRVTQDRYGIIIHSRMYPHRKRTYRLEGKCVAFHVHHSPPHWPRRISRLKPHPSRRIPSPFLVRQVLSCTQNQIIQHIQGKRAKVFEL